MDHCGVVFNHITTNWGLTLLVFWPYVMMANHLVFGPNFTIFGVKCPYFHGWHPLFFLWLASLLNYLQPLGNKNGLCRSVNGHLTPKTSLRLGFGGQMPFFPWVILTFFSMNRFAIEFWLFLTIWDHFRPLWYQSWA